MTEVPSPQFEPMYQLLRGVDLFASLSKIGVQNWTACDSLHLVRGEVLVAALDPWVMHVLRTHREEEHLTMVVYL